MATIKSYTSLEQSRKLAKFLPLESADMYYDDIVDSVTGELFIPDDGSTIKVGKGLGGSIAAWSLAALLNYLKSKNKFPEIKELSDGRFKLTTFIWDGKNSIQVSIADNLVDACYEMIIKLHELKML